MLFQSPICLRISITKTFLLGDLLWVDMLGAVWQGFPKESQSNLNSGLDKIYEAW